MKAFALTVAMILLFSIIIILLRVCSVEKQNKNYLSERFKSVKIIHNKIKNKEPLTSDEIFSYAVNPATREPLFQLFQEYDRIDLFPEEFYTIIKAAESNLVNWLKFPTELDAYPDEIEYVKRITVDFDGHNAHYEVFQYKMSEPHWAANSGWMLGVVGPYFDDSKPYSFPGATFSRVSSTADTASAEEEVKWVHENIAIRLK